MPNTIRQSRAPRTSCMTSVVHGRKMPVAQSTPARSYTRLTPVCTSTGITVARWSLPVRVTSSKTPACMSAPPTLGLGSSKWTRVGVKSVSWMCPYAKRTVTSGGKPVVPPLPARETGIKAGTGPQALTSAQTQHPVTRLSTTSRHQPAFARVSGVTPTRSATTAEGVAAASRCGLTQPRAIRMRTW